MADSTPRPAGYKVPRSVVFLDDYAANVNRSGVIDVSQESRTNFHKLHPFQYVARRNDARRIDWKGYEYKLLKKIEYGDKNVLRVLYDLRGKKLVSQFGAAHLNVLRSAIRLLAEMEKQEPRQHQIQHPLYQTFEKAFTRKERGEEYDRWLAKMVAKKDRKTIQALRDIYYRKDQAPYSTGRIEGQLIRKWAKKVVEEGKWAEDPPDPSVVIARRKESNLKAKRWIEQLAKEHNVSPRRLGVLKFAPGTFIMPFGKYKGLLYSEVPASYWNWIKDNFREEYTKAIYGEKVAKQAASLVARAVKRLGQEEREKFKAEYARIEDAAATRLEKEFAENFLKHMPKNERGYANIAYVKKADQQRLLHHYMTHPESKALLHKELTAREEEKLALAEQNEEKEGGFDAALDIRGQPDKPFRRDVQNVDVAAREHRRRPENIAAQEERSEDIQAEGEEKRGGPSKQIVKWHFKMSKLWEKIDSARNRDALEEVTAAFTKFEDETPGGQYYHPYIAALREQLLNTTNRIAAGEEYLTEDLIQEGGGGRGADEEGVRQQQGRKKLVNAVVSRRIKFAEREAKAMVGRRQEPLNLSRLEQANEAAAKKALADLFRIGRQLSADFGGLPMNPRTARASGAVALSTSTVGYRSNAAFDTSRYAELDRLHEQSKERIEKMYKTEMWLKKNQELLDPQYANKSRQQFASNVPKSVSEFKDQSPRSMNYLTEAAADLAEFRRDEVTKARVREAFASVRQRRAEEWSGELRENADDRRSLYGYGVLTSDRPGTKPYRMGANNMLNPTSGFKAN